jgi:hypothetical protein
VKGKIAYLSPEQCRAGEIDRRSDLFSLGIVMWEMLTTERLFNKPTDFDNMMSIINDVPPAPSALRPDVPSEIDAIVRRLLARQPEDRYQTAADVVDAIEEVAARSNSILSSSALGRSMKELFGQRPEPWIELTVERKPEVVTVTSEPIPAMITVAPNSSMEAQLAGVRDLSRIGALPAEPTLLPTSRPVMRLDASPSLPTVPAPPRQRSQVPLLVTGVAAAAIIASIAMYFVMRQKPAVVPAPIAIAATPPADARIDAPVAIDAFVPTVVVVADAGAPLDAAEAKPADDLLAALAAERFSEVVDKCLAAPSIAEHGAACTLAACHLHKLVEVKRWFSRVSVARRALVVQTCKSFNIQVEPSR